ncbi:aspartate-tRNA ligase [Macrolepiota fuliginosa MF-IS2]|uniref:Aspartate--tRNA ligase, cytoplasmic n=1 Tax=Macrolepiota fuliginosa MF-IS2 TaxID=1400762 RepID=A0A9P5XNF0_9AGAR|nr:aspartate-tRNA ligase [Macrolepiota fuliginosa MF-IS2]
MSENQPPAPVENVDGAKGPSKSELKKQAKLAEKAKKAAEKAAKQQELEQQKAAAEPDFAVEFYGLLPLNQSQSRPRRERVELISLSNRDGETVLFRARVQTSRAQGNKMVFLNLRQRTESVQALAVVTPEKISKQMVKWIASLPDESIVLVEGVVHKSPEPIKSATVSDIEVHMTKLHLISSVEGRLPFSLDDASRPETEIEDGDVQYNRVLLDTRLNNRVIDLRTQTNHAIFRLQAAIGELFREYLHANRFTEIHSPKLQGAATESGASVFKVGYFKGNAYLAQSPQLAKQMAIAADFERVYEIGPVFRAEDSNTHRHMTEFIGLDLEMAIEEHYHEVMELLDGLFLHIFRGLRDRYKREIEVVRQQFPADEFKWREGPEGTLKLTFKEAVDLLVGDGVSREELDDIDTKNEKRLGRVVKAKYDTDYFIIDKFPMALRPFYTMPDPEDPTISNSYDFFMRGEEILSGAQRIHDSQFLCEKMRSKGVDPESMKDYVNAFRMGCPPHGGGGIGLERVLMLFLKLNNIRRASLFPRDPKRLEP